MSLLDTVEPDCWLCGSDSVDAFIVWKKCDADTALKDGLDPSPWYAEATVESMLSQCRKEARKETLLEAAERCVRLTQAAHEFERPSGFTCARELRRMAESDNTTMEGEK